MTSSTISPIRSTATRTPGHESPAVPPTVQPTPFRRSASTAVPTAPCPRAAWVDGVQPTTQARAWATLNAYCADALRAWSDHPPHSVARWPEYVDGPYGLPIVREPDLIIKGQYGVFFNTPGTYPHARLIGDPNRFEFTLNGHRIGPNSPMPDIQWAQRIARKLYLAG